MSETLITNLSKYLAETYDGATHEWGEEEEALFDQIFHDDMKFSSFGHSSSQKLSGVTVRTKADRRGDEQKFISAGCFYFGKDGQEFTVIDERHLRWKASFKTPKFEANRDYLVEYSKDGKVLVLEPYNAATAIKPIHRQYIEKLYDGVPKELSGNELALFDAAFHEDYQELDATGNVVRNKHDMKLHDEKYLKVGLKITELELTPIDETRLVAKIHAKNAQIDVEEEFIVTAKDGRIWKLEKKELVA